MYLSLVESKGNSQKPNIEPGMDTFNPSPWKTQASGSRVQGHS